jgi:amidase
MSIKQPTIEELGIIANHCGFNLSLDDLKSFLGLIEPVLASYHRLEELQESTLPIRYPRAFGHQPFPEDNEFGAWYWKSEIKGSETGLLAGKTVAIKDNVSVAGIPMMNGTDVLKGYVPETDATLVTRILDAGGTILGKAVCESLCVSGGSHTSDTGPVYNPHDKTRSAGGSSSGSAVLVALSEVDMAIGGDQGGSIRIPAGWCGIYGLKATYGLVPYTGVFPVELTLDHAGPMARTALDCALLLESIAGPDGADPRQMGAPLPEPYTKALVGNVKGLKIGLVEEGFNIPGQSEKDVDEMVRKSAYSYEKLGARVKPVSIPWHKEGLHIFTAIIVEGMTVLMFSGNSMGTNWKGRYDVRLLDKFSLNRRIYADNLSDTTKRAVMLGQYMQDRYYGRYYAKAQNLARDLKAAYDHAFNEFDLLVMPTLPFKATRIPNKDASREESVNRALDMNINTAPFNVTGHPAMTVPCGTSSGLPIGMMIVGRTGSDATVLQAADAFQRNGPV